MRSDTTLYGELLTLSEHGASVDTPSHGPIPVKASPALLQEMVPLVGQFIGLDGTGIWDVESEVVLTEFEARSLLPYRETDVVTAFKELADSAGDRWKGVNPDEYVRSIRGRDEDE